MYTPFRFLYDHKDRLLSDEKMSEVLRIFRFDDHDLMKSLYDERAKLELIGNYKCLSRPEENYTPKDYQKYLISSVRETYYSRPTYSYEIIRYVEEHVKVEDYFTHNEFRKIGHIADSLDYKIDVIYNNIIKTRSNYNTLRYKNTLKSVMAYFILQLIDEPKSTLETFESFIDELSPKMFKYFGDPEKGLAIQNVVSFFKIIDTLSEKQLVVCFEDLFYNDSKTYSQITGMLIRRKKLLESREKLIAASRESKREFLNRK